MLRILGFDLGGSGAKTSILTFLPSLQSEKFQTIPTNQLATPLAVKEMLEMLSKESHLDAIGVAFPGVVKAGMTLTAAHVDPSWVHFPAETYFSKALGKSVVFVNDADAALVGEYYFGAAQNLTGPVLLLTLGTGIGSALMIQGKLWPNSELGHLMVKNGIEAEEWAAAKVRREERLSWKTWAGRLEDVLSSMVALLHPEVIVLGGAISEEFARFKGFLHQKTPIIPAKLGNRAGLIGAGWLAYSSEVGRN